MMSNGQDPVVAPPKPEAAPYDRVAVIASRNRVLGLLLGFMVVLFFAITIVKIMKH